MIGCLVLPKPTARTVGDDRLPMLEGELELTTAQVSIG